MRLRILDIVLYGPTAKPRIISFRPTGLNVITGWPRTGKTTLISVIDYCLGSRECEVSDGIMRRLVRWYGLRLQAGDQQVFVARKAPDAGCQTTSEAYYEVGTTLVIKDAAPAAATTNTDAVVDALSRLSGVGDFTHEPPLDQTRVPIPVSIRHALYFCFQRQDEIISQKHLFHKQSEQWGLQAIRDVLPFFLGAVDSDYMLKKARLARMIERLGRLRRQLQELEGIRGPGRKRADELLAAATDLGIRSGDFPADWEAVVGELRHVASTPIPSLPTAPPDHQGVVYEQMIERAETLNRAMERKRNERDAAKALLSHHNGYSSEGDYQVARLRSLELFAANKEIPTCPLCTSALTDSSVSASITAMTSDLQEQLRSVATNVPHIQKLVRTLDDELEIIKADVMQVRGQLDSLHRSSDRVKEYRDRMARIAHIQGRISLYLESLPEISDEPETLRKQIAAIQGMMKPLQEELSADAIEERLESILALLSKEITAAGQRLGLEYADGRLSIDRRRLQVVADTVDGLVPMDRIGSGANWVGYHVVVHLALHRWFSARRRPVPGFVILDQPSQIGFPAETVERRQEDADRNAVMAMMRLVWEYASDEAHGFQAIVTEHADFDEEWFQDSVIERWREGAALIPKEWINHQGST